MVVKRTWAAAALLAAVGWAGAAEAMVPGLSADMVPAPVWKLFGVLMLGFFLVTAATPFLAHWLMPRRRWIAAYLTVVLMGNWVLDRLVTSSMPEAENQGEMIAYGTFFLMQLASVAGAAIGALMRLVWLSRWGRPPLPPKPVSPLCWVIPLAPVVVVLGFSYVIKPVWRALPPSKACLEGDVLVHAGPNAYRLPAGGPFDLGGYLGGRLYDRAELRQLCLKDPDQRPDNSVLVDFTTLADRPLQRIGTRPDRPVDPTGAARRARLCARGQAWTAELCRTGAVPAAWPERVNLSRPDSCGHCYDEQYRQDVLGQTPRGGTARAYAPSVRSTRVEGFAVHEATFGADAPKPGVRFAYFVADPEVIAPGAGGQPAVLRCLAPGPLNATDRWACSAHYELLPGRLEVEYGFEARDPADIPARWRETDAMVRTMERDLRVR